MDCLAILDSGNYVYSLCRILEKMGYVFEVVSTPCQVAKNGCGYCLRFPMKYSGLVMEAAKSNGLQIREMYRIVPRASKNKYEKIY